jgi:hypothetical protein
MNWKDVYQVIVSEHSQGKSLWAQRIVGLSGQDL